MAKAAGVRLGRSVAVLLSAAFHVCIVMGLLWAMRPAAIVQDPPISEVVLFPSNFDVAHPDAERHRRQSGPAKSGLSPRPQPGPDLPTPLMPDERPAASPPSAATGGLAPSLRAALGCRHADFLGLSETERERCRLRLGEGRGTTADLTGFGVGPNARAAFDRGTEREKFLTTPFLSSMPKKGCKPMLTEREAGVYGKAAPDWTVSVGCGVPF